MIQRVAPALAFVLFACVEGAEQPEIGTAEQAVTFGSCAGYCGRRWEAQHGGGSCPNQFPGQEFWCEWPEVRKDGCSCEADCGHQGTCCPDAKDYCDAIDGEVDYWDIGSPMMDGEQWIAVQGPVHMAASKRIGRRTRYIVPHVSPGPNISAAGLTRVTLRELDTQGEHAMCEITLETPPGESQEYWTLAAATYLFGGASADQIAACEAIGLRFPGGTMGITDPVHVNASNGSIQTVQTSYPTWRYFPLLTRVWLEDIDGENEYAGCSVYESGGNWRVEARADDDSDARCGARFLDRSPSTATMVTTCPSITQIPPTNDIHHITGCGAGQFFAYAMNGEHTESKVSMMPEAGYTCFLQGVMLEESDNGDELADCEIYPDDGKWWLVARSHNDQETYCTARCLDLGTSQYDWLFQNNWPPIPNAEVTSPLGMAGMEMHLIQSGNYDQPVVLLEGFDPTNRSSPAYWSKRMALLLRKALYYGLDVWIVDYTGGGQSLVKSARQSAAAVDVAFKHANFNTNYPGREIVVAGVSMGGLAGRIMLASWEEGRYTDPASPEYISTSLGNGVPPGGERANAPTNYLKPYDPPVSLFASVNSPHHGANIPDSLQILLQDVSSILDLGEATAALNSPAAINMLEEHVDNRCTGLVTETCSAAFGFISRRVTKNGGFTLDGSECPTYRNTGCSGWYFDIGTLSWVCPPQNQHTPSDDFYEDVNHRGVAGPHGVFSGFPHSVVTMGLTNGSWNYQSCSAMPPFEECSYGWQLGSFSVTTQTFMGICERSTNVVIMRQSDDTRPGDLGIRTMDQLVLGSLPKAVVALNIEQNYAPMFVPTRSALNCIAGTDDSICEWWNNVSDGFDRVRSNWESYNGYHATVAPAVGAAFLAFVFDGYRDADGHPGSSNPLYDFSGQAPGGGPLDCDDYDAEKFPGNPEVCHDGKDNDCDGAIDNRTTDCSCGSWGCPDVTGDLAVTSADVNALNTHMNTNEGQGTSLYDPLYDLDCDGDIDAADQNRMLAMVGAQCQSGNPDCATTEFICCDGNDDDCDGSIDEGCNCGGGGGCFAAGTLITMADGSTRPIEEIVPGDVVLSFDQATGRLVPGEVVRLFVHPDTPVSVVINDTLRTTSVHRFFVDGKWIPASDLEVGDRLYRLSTSADASAATLEPIDITSFECRADPEPVYNFEVKKHHNYFAGGLLVHNRKIIVADDPP